MHSNLIHNDLTTETKLLGKEMDRQIILDSHNTILPGNKKQ